MSYEVRKPKQRRSMRLHCSMSADELKTFCGVKNFPSEGSWVPSHNLFPGDSIPVLTPIPGRPGRQMCLTLCQWGIPNSKTNGDTAMPVSRAETIYENPSDCDKQFIRGVIICQGYFAWSRRIQGSKLAADCRPQVYYMRAKDERTCLKIAALVHCEKWYNSNNTRVIKYKHSVKFISRPIVTNEEVMPSKWKIITTRMPLMINDEELQDWLNPRLTIARFLDRRSPDKLHKTVMAEPKHVGFWLCDPDIKDDRVLQSRMDWDKQVAAKEVECEWD